MERTGVFREVDVTTPMESAEMLKRSPALLRSLEAAPLFEPDEQDFLWTSCEK